MFSNNLSTQRVAMHSRILATKVGMTQVYDDDGNIHPVTVLEELPGLLRPLCS